MKFLFALITTESILGGFWSFRKIQKSKMADKDGCHSEITLLNEIFLTLLSSKFREFVNIAKLKCPQRSVTKIGCCENKVMLPWN